MIISDNEGIRYDLIKPSHYFRKVTGFDSLQHVNFQLVNECLITRDSIKKEIVFRRFRQYPFGKQFRDSSVMNASGPVNYHMYTDPLSKKLDTKFNLKSTEAEPFVNGRYSKVINAIDPGYLDDNILEKIIGFIPLKRGLKYHLETFRFESKNGKSPYDLEYLYDDVLPETNDKVKICSVIHLVNEHAELFIWVDQATHKNVKEIIRTKNSVTLIQLI